MEIEPRIYRHGTREGSQAVGVGSIFIFGAIVGSFIIGFGSTKVWLMLLPLVPGLTFIILGWRHLSDQRPKLTLDRDALTNHRAKAGEVRIPWREIESVDAKFASYTIGEMTVYQRTIEAQGEGWLTTLTTHKINLGHLERPATELYTEIKQFMLCVR